MKISSRLTRGWMIPVQRTTHELFEILSSEVPFYYFSKLCSRSCILHGLLRMSIQGRLTGSVRFDGRRIVYRWIGGTPRLALTAGSGRALNTLTSTDTFRRGAYPLSARPSGLQGIHFGLRRCEYGPTADENHLPVARRAWLQFGVEVFNLTNHPNPLRVSPYYASRDRRLDSYGQAMETLNARQIQWLVQLEY